MELIKATEAYASTLLARRLKMEKLALYFNKVITEAAAKGNTTCIIRWKDFDMDEELATDEDTTIQLIESIVSAGYDAEFCYNNPYAFNPCGIVIAWGEETEKLLNEAFAQVDGQLYRGE